MAARHTFYTLTSVHNSKNFKILYIIISMRQNQILVIMITILKHVQGFSTQKNHLVQGHTDKIV